MLVGNGLIASIFLKYKTDNSILFFASGVSNSLEINEAEFNREKDLLMSNLTKHNKLKFVYFSTCSVYDPSLTTSPYIIHKKKIESLITSHHDNYLIVRLPNIVGPQGNRHTLINHFVSSVRNNDCIYIWKNSTRNILDQADVLEIVEKILDRPFRNEIINVASPMNYRVLDILNEVERYLNKKANYILLDKGANYDIDIAGIGDIIQSLQKDFSINYLRSILKKYY